LFDVNVGGDGMNEPSHENAVVRRDDNEEDEGDSSASGDKTLNKVVMNIYIIIIPTYASVSLSCDAKDVCDELCGSVCTCSGVGIGSDRS
jgi:hypothetical protein